MTGELGLSEQEWVFRFRRYQQLRAQVNDRLDEEIKRVQEYRASNRDELVAIIDRFRAG